MRPEIDPPVLAALLGKPPFHQRGGRLCWWRIAALVVTSGFWCLAAWAIAALTGAKA